MSKTFPNSIGIDIGTHSIKGLALSRRGADKAIVSKFAVRSFGGKLENSDELVHHLKLVLSELGGATKAIGVATSSPDAFLKIIEQYPTPPDLLRRGLAINGLALLNQDISEMVVDCDLIAKVDLSTLDPKAQLKYLVAGIPRSRVAMLDEAFRKMRLNVSLLQLAPIALLNAFEFCKPDIYQNETFMIVDIGHSQSTVMVGSRKELLLVRSVEFGGKILVEALTSGGGIEAESAMLLFNQGDAGMIEIAHQELVAIARELRSSIGFVEGQREEVVNKIYISGGLAKSEQVLQLLSDETNIPFELWDPFEDAETGISKSRIEAFDAEMGNLTIAYGAALEAMFPE
ncbi:MAG TPA: pilus assembly protein PilM [Chthoniobacterales bacterium]|jgi:type IV pilus assembly protein PilM